MPGVLLPRKVVRNTHKIRSVTGYIVTSNYPGSSCPLIFDSRNFMRVRTCEVHTAKSRKGIFEESATRAQSFARGKQDDRTDGLRPRGIDS